jgi:type I restriction enzyme S subunit
MKKGWQIKTLGDICVIKTGKKDVNQGNPNGRFPFFTCAKEHTFSDSFSFDTEALLIAGNGDVGNVSYYNGKFEAYQRTYVLSGFENILPKFLFQILDGSLKASMSNQKLGNTMPYIKLGMLKEFEIPLPPLPEQQRIIAILDKAFTSITQAKANTEQNLRNIQELFDNYLHDIFNNKSNGWEIRKLSEVAEYFNGLTYSPKDVGDTGIIVLRSSNVQNNQLDFSDIVRVNKIVKDKIIVKDGDILMCSRNGSKKLVGKTATIKNLKEEMTFGTFMMIIRGRHNPYLSWFFKSNNFRRQISGGENTMINQITRYMLDDVVVSFPPIEIENGIVNELDILSGKIEKMKIVYQKKLDNLDDLKRSILAKAFAGKL